MSMHTDAAGHSARAEAEATPRASGQLAKALFDRVLAALLLLSLSPLMAFVALFVLLVDGRPVIFAHPRVGREGREFRCLKFRTMRRDGDRQLRQVLASDPIARAEWEAERKLERDPRVPRWGAVLRKLSLDELPQLVNVLRGEMSLVGPRPITRSELALYGAHARDYISVTPGLTGLWQVSGRNALSYQERVALDVAYAREHGFFSDLAILLRTVPAVLSRRGAS